MEFKDYYKILGVERDANLADIKRAYKKLARKFHPDVSKEANAETRFKEINEAYHALKDPEKRAAYDRLGSQWKSGQEFHPPPDWHIYTGHVDEDNLGVFSDFFDFIFGRNRSREKFHFEQSNVRRRGKDIHSTIHIRLEDAFHGATRTLSLRTPDPVAGKPGARQLNVHIPRGVYEGQQIRLTGQGDRGTGGAPAGDLFLQILFEPHPYFHAEGRDIFLELPITPWEAALGAHIEVHTLGGQVELVIPSGSQSGRKLRLKQRGLPGNPPGDQYVVLRVETPPADSEAARAFYEQMAKTMPFNPRHTQGL